MLHYTLKHRAIFRNSIILFRNWIVGGEVSEEDEVHWSEGRVAELVPCNDLCSLFGQGRSDDETDWNMRYALQSTTFKFFICLNSLVLFVTRVEPRAIA